MDQNDTQPNPHPARPKVTLTSLQNPKVKSVVRLRKRQYRDRLRRALVDGRKELLCALDGGHSVEEVFWCESMLEGSKAEGILGRAAEAGAEITPVSAKVFERMAYGDRAEGVLGVIETPEFSLDRLPQESTPLIVVVEGLEKPGNLGAVLRSADAAGATGLIVCDAQTDILNPNAIRSSLGTIFTVPIAEAGSPEALEWLRDQGIQILAATPHTERHYTQVDLTTPCAIVLGSEHDGLTPLWMDGADQQIAIPMRGAADSLNLAMSATVLLFEAVRQRDAAAAKAVP